MKVTIKFPQVVIEEKEIEVTQEQFENAQENPNSLVGLVWGALDEQEQKWVPGGRESLPEATDIGYCSIEGVTQEEEDCNYNISNALGRCH